MFIFRDTKHKCTVAAVTKFPLEVNKFLFSQIIYVCKCLKSLTIRQIKNIFNQKLTRCLLTWHMNNFIMICLCLIIVHIYYSPSTVLFCSQLQTCNDCTRALTCTHAELCSYYILGNNLVISVTFSPQHYYFHNICYDMN